MQSNLHNSGFSMVEVIIVVVVIAIFAGLSTPILIDSLNRSREQQEENQMIKIQEAMQIFLEQYDQLPSITTAGNAFCNTPNSWWQECLAKVSNLSAYQISTDTWGNPRTYTHFVDTSAILLGANVDMHYAAIFSTGKDEEAQDKDAAGVAIPNISTIINTITGRRVFNVTNSGIFNEWWHIGGTTSEKLSAFQQLAVGKTNYIAKFTNHKIKMEQYEVTLERMAKISDALETYSRAKYNEAIIVGEANADKKVFYPLSRDPVGDASTNYGTSVVTANTTYAFSNSNRVENRDSTNVIKANRRDDMIKLMRLIGLPDSYCCNEMEKDPDNNYEQRALFYYSNPLAVTPIGCSTRQTVASVSPLYFPPRLATEIYACP